MAMCLNSKKVKAFARVKPTADFPQDVIKFGADNKTIEVHIERDRSKGIVNNKVTDWSFKMDGVLYNASQDLVYDTVAKELVSQALNGYNGTIMCYGQTGAGKTFTMTGTTVNFKHRGIIPRAIQQVFKSMEKHSNQFITVRISYLEIHNEVISDLLPSLGSESDLPLSIVESPHGVSVKGLSIHPAPNEEIALNLLFEGDTNRSVGQHALNKHSSRSHCIFTIYIECHSRIVSDARYVTSKINLVDLAGSERLSKSKSEGFGLKEATYINKSLSFLEQVVIALSDCSRDHVPFRQSKLTYTLKDSLGGNCNTVLVANICSESIHIVETLSTLRFATRMKWVTTLAIVNEKINSERMVKNLEKEVLYLKEELAMHNSLLNRSPVTYEPLNEIQINEINSQVRRFLEGTIDELDITSIRQIQEIFNQFKIILRSKIDNQRQANFSSSCPTTRKEGLSSPISGKDLETLSGSRSQVAASGKDLDGKEGLFRDQEASSLDTHRSDSAPRDDSSLRPSSPPTRTSAFEDFKGERGSEINRIFKENKAILNERKRKLGEVTQRINLVKQEMDVTRQALEIQKLEREQQGEYLNDEGQVIIDEEEFLLIMKLKDLRKQYRDDFGELRDLRSEVQYCQSLVDQCRNRLLTEFDIWYNESFLIPEEVKEALRPGGSIRLGMIPMNRVLTLDEDEQERFDRMQQEVLPFCPASVSFYNAKAKVDRKHKYSRAMSAFEQMRKKPGSVQSAVKTKPPSLLDIM
ncbi:PREDICTED: kinesin-like protein KIF9 [Thamnophis sirtalis]|uniref:Kinesin-like protein n=1 Tax=Thamnophis sirtalis TaxID=35019 RepID=A0A6I9XN35_9SAUR|nr:PREDICTED: kinesin-like protein KIF9 [Thamnophis sirtalis]